MRKHRGYNTGKNNLFKKLIFMNVKAEEPQGTQPSGNEPNEPNNNEPNTEGNKAPTVNFEDLIANARKQEKEKLYPQIQKLEEKNRTLIEKNNEHLLTIGKKDARIEELEKEIKSLKDTSSKGASEKEAQLTKEVETLREKVKTLESTTVSREEIENEIKAEYEVKLYREQKLREVGDTVIPELVTGTSKEEIDASIQLSQQRYAQITDKVLGGVNVPVANANTSTFQIKDLKIEDIANLDPRSPEYAQFRAKMGLK